HARRPRPQCPAGSAGARSSGPKGRPLAVAGANHHAHATSVGRNETPQGVGFWIPVSLATGRRGVGVRRRGSGKPGVKGRSAHPEAPGTTPRKPTPSPQGKV